VSELQHTHISAKHKVLDLKLDEVWRYRDLIYLFTKRAVTVAYKQTILGPAWLFINPLLTCAVYVVLFGNIAKLSTDGVPQLLFYMVGNAIWNYFSSCVSNNANTFTGNAGLFGKVYFPRLVVPLSNVLSAVIRFGIQLVLVLGLLFYYVAVGLVVPNWSAWLCIPVILLQLGIMGMGFGIIISSLTTKYRDLNVLVGFGLQLWMYATPIVYPLSAVTGWVRNVILINPVTAPAEMFRYAVLGIGSVSVAYLALSLGVTIAVALFGIIIFNKVERNFMDTV
jgi:lipopolysaccharide transport system permease protein